jgi:hypothetical protein
MSKMLEETNLKLSKEDTILLYEKLKSFYNDIETIQDYFIKRKKEKISNIDYKKYTDNIFNDNTINPKDMEFELDILEGKIFNPITQIIISLPLESQIGRQIMIGVKEKNTNKYVGFIRLASPILSIKPRNDIFGDFKLKANEVNRFMINGSIILPVQPFGYNYLGGKLLALICSSHEVREIIKQKYGDKADVVFLETTSLYGDIKGVSQYDGLEPFIKYGGMTESDLFLFPNDKLFLEIRDFLRKIFGNSEWNGSLVDPKGSGPKMREFNKMVSIIKNHLKIYDVEKFNEFNLFTKTHMKAKTKKRYYYSNYGYDNVLEHIKSDGKIELKKRNNWDRYYLKNLISWWKNKSQNRYEKLIKENRLRTELEIYTTETIDNKITDMVR